MNEADFRDWMRGQLRSLDERLKAVEARPDPARPPPASRELKGEMAELAEGLAKRVKAGDVAAVAIAFLSAEGVAHTGYVAGLEAFPLVGAIAGLHMRVLEGVMKAEVGEEASHADQPA